MNTNVVMIVWILFGFAGFVVADLLVPWLIDRGLILFG